MKTNDLKAAKQYLSFALDCLEDSADALGPQSAYSASAQHLAAAISLANLTEQARRCLSVLGSLENDPPA